MYEVEEFVVKEEEEELDLKHSMRWYIFITYVALYLAAVMNLVYGFMVFTGGNYADPAYVYAAFPGLRILDIIMTVLSWGMAVFCIVVQKKLKKFRQSGPMLLQYLMLVNIAVQMGYCLAATFITKMNLFSAYTVVSILATLVIIAVNKKYFEKRSYVFKD